MIKTELPEELNNAFALLRAAQDPKPYEAWLNRIANHIQELDKRIATLGNAKEINILHEKAVIFKDEALATLSKAKEEAKNIKINADQYADEKINSAQETANKITTTIERKEREAISHESETRAFLERLKKTEKRLELLKAELEDRANALALREKSITKAEAILKQLKDTKA